MSGGASRRAAWRDIPGSVWVLGFVSLLMDVSSEMIHALLPIYLAAVLGASALTIGAIEGLAEATSSITKIFSGVWSDRWGKRKALAALGYGLAAFSKPIFPLASSVAWVAAARFVDRVGKGIRGAPRDALITDVSPKHARGAAFGLRQSLDTVGAVLGPLSAIVLMAATANRFTLVFWIAVVPALLSFLLILFGVREPIRSTEGSAADRPKLRSEWALLGPRFWRVAGATALFGLARFSDAFLILRARSLGLPEMAAPGVLVVMNVAFALSAYPVGALSDRLGRDRMLRGGLVLLAAADATLAFAAGWVGLASGAALWGLHMGFTQGLLAAMVADAAPRRLRGTAFGVFYLIHGLALLAGAVAAGALWDAVGPRGTYLAGVALTLPALAAASTLPREKPTT